MAQTLVEHVINEVRTLPEQELRKILDFVMTSRNLNRFRTKANKYRKLSSKIGVPSERGYDNELGGLTKSYSINP